MRLIKSKLVGAHEKRTPHQIGVKEALDELKEHRENSGPLFQGVFTYYLFHISLEGWKPHTLSIFYQFFSCG